MEKVSDVTSLYGNPRTGSTSRLKDQLCNGIPEYAAYATESAISGGPELLCK